MLNFDALNESAEIQVELVTLAGVEKITAKEGMTVKEFKEANNLVGTKMIDDNSDVLRDSDIIEEGMQIYVSTPKKNG
jgi:LysM repeat protein